MIERRKTTRTRTYLGGRVSYNRQFSTMDCLVRNLTAEGAKLELSGAVALPDEVDLTIAQRESVLRARLLWRRGEEAGLAFIEPRAQRDVIPFRLGRRLRDREAENRRRQNVPAAEPPGCD